MSCFNEISEGVIKGNQNLVKEKVQELIDNGTDPLEIINQGLMAGMNIVGARFKEGDMFVPEVMIAARAMGAGIALVKPLINDADVSNAGKVVIGTVKGDLHDIGKNLVTMMIESAGFNVVNIGIDISPEKFAEAIKEHDPDIVGMSAMLTTTMTQMKETIDHLKNEGLRDSVKVIVGGAPVTQQFAEEIGADGYSADASSAAELCKELVSLASA
ncbi:corrinoid protein [Wukongibacter baidiensis]|uniref:cobalamin B12-binding domain-containing protein n=1 Tax=Wukongibacter baidiensis TaxID=1723361 RepID=UPI003D7F6DE9